MDNENIFKLIRFNGIEEYIFPTGKIFLNSELDNKYYAITVRANKCIKTLKDTKILNALPNYEINIPIDKLKELQKGKKFFLKSGYDEKTFDYLTNLYYCEHEVINNNIIELLDIKRQIFKLKITGETLDINYYDGSKPNTKIEIIGNFSIED